MTNDKEIQVENNDIDVEGNFEKYKIVEIQILEVKQVLTQRIDSYNDIRNFYYDFYKEYPTHEQAMELLLMCEELNKKMLAHTQEMTLEDFQVDEYADPYKDLYSTTHECANTDEAFKSLVCFNFVRPFAERLYSVYRQVQADINGDILEVTD